MALQKNYSKNIYGQTLTFNTAYHKIISLNGNKDNINIQVTIYSNNLKECVVAQKEYTFIPDLTSTAKNFIQQGYEYLKSLDEYKDVVDLLDEGQTA